MDLIPHQYVYPVLLLKKGEAENTYSLEGDYRKP